MWKLLTCWIRLVLRGVTCAWDCKNWSSRPSNRLTRLFCSPYSSTQLTFLSKPLFSLFLTSRVVSFLHPFSSLFTPLWGNKKNSAWKNFCFHNKKKKEVTDIFIMEHQKSFIGLNRRGWRDGNEIWLTLLKGYNTYVVVKISGFS